MGNLENRKRIIVGLLVVIIILVSIIIGLLIYKDNYNKNINKTKYMDEIIEKINNKESMIIYIDSNSDECGYCKDTNNIIEYYEDIYGIEFFRFNKKSTTIKDFNKLIEYFDIDDELVELPMVVIVVDGEFKSMTNFLTSEAPLREQLITYGFLSEEYASVDNSINYKEFTELYASSSESLLVFYNYEKETYKIREVMLDIVKEYNFDYYNVYSGYSDSAKITRVVYLELRNKFSLPCLVIVSDNKIVDYISSVDKNEIMSFLRKHNYID